MSSYAFLLLSWGLGIAALLAVAISIVSLALVLFRWRRPQRRGHAIRLLLAVVAVPCLFGGQQAVAWWLFMPAAGREIQARYDARRAEKLAATSSIHVGDSAPDFTVTDADGAAFMLSHARGKVVLLNFFATWCGPCQNELPHLEEIWNEHRETSSFELLVIGREETDETVRAFRAERGYTFAIAADPDRAIFDLYAQEGIPRTLVVSRDGVVVYSKAGFMEEDLAQLQSVLAEHLGAAPPRTP